MTLRVEAPSTFGPERRYVYSVLLEEFLGLDVVYEVREGDGTRIVHDRKSLFVADGLFKTSAQAWLKPESLPREPLCSWGAGRSFLKPRLMMKDVPVLYGRDPESPSFLVIRPGSVELGLDVFGSCFFLLTRYEEIVERARDAHNRFGAQQSVLGRAGLVERAIVNEYLEVLWAGLRLLWPSLKRTPREFRVLLSHDVDRPFEHAFADLWRLGRAFGGDLVRRRSPRAAARRVYDWARVKMGHAEADPFYNFGRIMSLAERNGLRSAFYFLADRTVPNRDGDYELSHAWIRGLLREIHARGHEIGLHGSYETYRDSDRVKRELRLLQDVCAREGISQSDWGGRQHYLRWEAPVTWRAYEAAGLKYDSSLAFADAAGFRCGVCYEFSPYDVSLRRQLAVRERPLIAMERTIIDSAYMGLGWGDKASAKLAQLKETCRFWQGDFTLLWHNSELVSERAWVMLEDVVAG